MCANPPNTKNSISAVVLIPLGKIQSMEVDQLEALKNQELILLLPQRKPQRAGLPGAGHAWLYKHEKSAGRDAGVAESSKP